MNAGEKNGPILAGHKRQSNIGDFTRSTAHARLLRRLTRRHRRRRGRGGTGSKAQHPNAPGLHNISADSDKPAARRTSSSPGCASSAG